MSWPWSHPLVLNPRLLDQESSTFTIAHYTLDSRVSLSSRMCHLSLLEFGKNKSKLRKIYSKNHENFKNRKPTGSYKKKVYSNRLPKLYQFSRELSASQKLFFVSNRGQKKKRKLFAFSFNEYKGEKSDIPQMNASQLSPNDSLLIMIEANFSCIHIDFYSLMKCVLFFAFLYNSIIL